jgi:hypothetical protein
MIVDVCGVPITARAAPMVRWNGSEITLPYIGLACEPMGPGHNFRVFLTASANIATPGGNMRY